MALRGKPTLVQLERQSAATLALLPYVAGLPFLDDEALVRIFGQTMAILNWVRAIGPAPNIPLELILPVRRTRTKEEKRAYMREYKRRERRRAKVESLQKQRAAIDEQIADLIR